MYKPTNHAVHIQDYLKKAPFNQYSNAIMKMIKIHPIHSYPLMLEK